MPPLTDLVAELAAALHLDDLAPGEDGAYALVFDSRLEIEIVPMGQSRFLLRSRLPAVPAEPEARHALLAACLQRNVALLREAPAAVALDAETEQLWLYRTADAATLDGRSALELLEEFVNLVELWSRFQPAAPPPIVGGAPFGFLLRP